MKTKDKDLKGISSLLEKYQQSSEQKSGQNGVKKEKKKSKRELKPFQIWALKFADKYNCEKSIPILMRMAKKYQGSIDYLRYVEGWLDDYPNKGDKVIGLFLWKLKDDRLKREQNRAT